MRKFWVVYLKDLQEITIFVRKISRCKDGNRFMIIKELGRIYRQNQTYLVVRKLL